MKIKILVKDASIEAPKIISKGDWIDLKAQSDICFEAPYANTLRQVDGLKRREVVFDHKLFSLGVAMKLPKGFEAVVLPRSSTFGKYGIMLVNSQGVIDNSYQGDNDVWKFHAIAFQQSVIHKGDRVAQFRIQLSQKATLMQKLRWLFSNKIEVEYVDHLEGKNRGGFGSTGVK